MNMSKKRVLFAAGLTVAAVAVAPSAVSAQSYDHGYDSGNYKQARNWHDDCNTGMASMTDKTDGTVVDALANDGRFTTLVAAVKAAGLVDALNSTDQKTVFAPTDEAFAKLPAGTVDALLADPAKLAEILKYHVVAGAVDAEAAVDAGEATTLNGQMVNIGEGNDGNVYVNDSVLEQTDIMTNNGIVHVIDAVLMPKM